MRFHIYGVDRLIDDMAKLSGNLSKLILDLWLIAITEIKKKS